MKLNLISTILCGTLLIFSRNVQGEAKLSPVEIARSCLCEITTINFFTGKEFYGTGVIIRENGSSYLYSNAHVLLGGKIIAKNLLGKNVVLEKPQILEDDPRDMIRFKVYSDYGFRIGKLPQPGARIFSYGNAGGEGITKKEGLYSGILENLDIRHTIPIRGGDSGGPIFNSENQVIGINWASVNINGNESGLGASFLNLKWKENSSELFYEFSKEIARADHRLDFWYSKQNTISPDFINSTRSEWLPKMQEMLNITDRERVAEAYKFEPLSKTFGAVSLEDHFSSSLELLYSFVPAPIEAQKTTASLLRFYIDLELKKISKLASSLPEKSWIKENYLSMFQSDYKNLRNIFDNIPESNHDLSLFVDSVDSKKWIRVKGDLVPVIALPMLGRFWDSFYKKFYNGKNFGQGGVTINRNCYLGPAYLQYVCSEQWTRSGTYKFGIMNRGRSSAVLTRTALMHMFDKVERIEFKPGYWKPEWDAKLKKGISDGHINGKSIPQFIKSVSSPIYQKNMVIKAEEYMLEAQSDAQIAKWVSFATGKELIPLSRLINMNKMTYSKDSKLIKGIDSIDPKNRPKSYFRY